MLVKLSVEFDNNVWRRDFEGRVWSDDGKNNLYQLITVSLNSKSSMLICAMPMKFFLSILPKLPQTMLYDGCSGIYICVRVVSEVNINIDYNLSGLPGGCSHDSPRGRSIVVGTTG